MHTELERFSKIKYGHDFTLNIVEKINDNQLLVFSGKIPTCVEAYKKISKIINKK